MHVDLNQKNLNQLNPADSTNIRPIHNSENISEIDKILTSPVYSPVHASPIFTYGSASNPSSPSYYSSEEVVTPKGNPKPCNNPPNTLLYVPAYLDSDPSFSYYS